MSPHNLSTLGKLAFSHELVFTFLIVKMDPNNKKESCHFARNAKALALKCC